MGDATLGVLAHCCVIWDGSRDYDDDDEQFRYYDDGNGEHCSLEDRKNFNREMVLSRQ